MLLQSVSLLLFDQRPCDGSSVSLRYRMAILLSIHKLMKSVGVDIVLRLEVS